MMVEDKYTHMNTDGIILHIYVYNAWETYYDAWIWFEIKQYRILSTYISRWNKILQIFLIKWSISFVYWFNSNGIIIFLHE
jgi:hypothetical protein